MRFHLPLRSQVLLCALLNIGVLMGSLAVLFWSQFDAGFESFLLAPTQAKLRGLTDRLTDDLVRTPVENRPDLLDRYEAEFGVRLGLFDAGGVPIAGNLSAFPPLVHRAFVPADGAPRKMTATGGAKKKKGFEPGRAAGDRPRHPIFTVRDRSSYWFGVRTPIPAPRPLEVQHGVLLVNTPSLIFNGSLFDVRPWLFGVLFVSAMTMACWLPFVRSLTRSIHAMQEGAGSIAAGQFDVRLPADGRDEVGRLGEALNQMAARLKGLVHGQRRFLGDIAHELSAPLARLQASIGILQDRSQEQPQIAKYVNNVAGEVSHMSELVHELLHFSKAGLVQNQPARTPLVLSGVVEKVLIREQAQEKVSLLEGGHLAVLANEDGLSRALSNLVRNAVRYAAPDGPVTISASKEQDHVLLKVLDQGPGLPEEAIEQIFTPFFRVESSRSRESGGTGLGMAIVRACVESSGGVVWCRNRSPRGLEVIVRLQAA